MRSGPVNRPNPATVASTPARTEAESRTSSFHVIDEVQKVPAVLDEVHRLIEDAGLDFVLCGSSARKLKPGRANLLGGRAWRFELHPLAWPEIDARRRMGELPHRPPIRC